MRTVSGPFRRFRRIARHPELNGSVGKSVKETNNIQLAGVTAATDEWRFSLTAKALCQGGGGPRLLSIHDRSAGAEL